MRQSALNATMITQMRNGNGDAANATLKAWRDYEYGVLYPEIVYRDR